MPKDLSEPSVESEAAALERKHEELKQLVEYLEDAAKTAIIQHKEAVEALYDFERDELGMKGKKTVQGLDGSSYEYPLGD